jgi:hypothetical protein
MRAHIWLGLLTVPLVVLHTGFRLGGLLPMVLTILFAAVIASGVFGLWLQQIIPRMMLDQVANETIYTQINRVSQQLANEARAILQAVGGDDAETAARRSPTVEVASVAQSQEASGGVYRTWQVKTLERQIAVKPMLKSEGLATFYRNELLPFLLQGNAVGGRLAHGGSAFQVFDALRSSYGAAGHSAVDAFEDLARQRRELDTQARLHGWLHGWLAVHLGLSVALILLMLFHIYTALRYW